MTITLNPVIPMPSPLRVFNRVKKAAEREPNRLAACRYVWTDANFRTHPECIVGTALAELGVPLDVLGNVNGYTVSGLYGVPLGKETATLQKLRAVQAHQDAGCTWGEAMQKVLDGDLDS